ncbi:MAG: hypothetical protein AAGD43_31885 [Pseudomonadota bacterium]
MTVRITRLGLVSLPMPVGFGFFDPFRIHTHLQLQDGLPGEVLAGHVCQIDLGAGLSPAQLAYQVNIVGGAPLVFDKRFERLELIRP